MPNFVPSSPENVDMDRLKRDIPKFLNNSRIITEDQKHWWNEFFEKSNETYHAETNKSRTWLLDELKLVKSRSLYPNNDHVTLQENEEEQPSAVPECIPSELTELVNGQLAEIPEV